MYNNLLLMSTLKYSLDQIENISFNGFNYTVPEKTMNVISSLASQVGSPSYDKTPVFKKRETPQPHKDNATPYREKRKHGKEIVNDDDWESIRTFQTTKLETKTGVEGDFDTIRSYINKLTDKNYLDMRTKIMDIIDKIENEHSLADLGKNIFEVASSNRYYSKIYADLYSDLSMKYAFIRDKYQENLAQFIDLFNHIEYVDPNENYDKFCEINKLNEKRKSLASFYVNLMNNNIIQKSEIVTITRNLLANVYDFISEDNKKNEVEELTETIVLLYKKELYEKDDGEDYESIRGFTINEIIEKIANSKVKDYKSLTSKTIFKFMDLMDDM